MTTTDQFLSQYTQALADCNAAVFAGAGLSIPAGLVDWKRLMRSIASEIGLDVEKEHDLIAVAQYHQNERGGRHRINQVLLNEFSSRAKSTENHQILARLPIQTYWTTNYDSFIEDGLRHAGKKVDVKTTAENVATTLAHRDSVVYKMHGDISDPATAVITKDDYEAYATTRRGQLFSTALRGDLVEKTFLFIGFSFSDPNLDYILSRIRILLDVNRREHYCLMRRVQRRDFDTSGAYRYARTKQDLQIRDLRRYGIIAVVVDNYGEYTNLLRQLESRYRRSQVFVSGSASTYTPWTESSAQQFLTLLGEELAKHQMTVVSGFGVGVGPYVINGVLEQLEKEGTRNLNDRLVLRPFPYTIGDSKKRKERWRSYRQEMISRAGIAVIVFGNRTDDSGVIVPAEGVLEEFGIAKKLGVVLVPVGCTGSVAKSLHSAIEKEFTKHYPANVKGLRKAYIDLNKLGRPKEIVDRVISFIEKLAAIN
jgi:Sir2- and TIR-associating SLOG family/SIR2-like domain